MHNHHAFIPRMSYTQDPSLRRHTYGAIEPMDYTAPRAVAVGVVALFCAPFLLTIAYLVWRAL